MAEQREIVVLVVFEVAEGQLDQMVDDITGFAQNMIAHQPGFVSSHLHQSLDGRRLFDYARWRSIDDFRAAISNPQVRQAAAVVSRYQPTTTFTVPIAAVWGAEEN